MAIRKKFSDNGGTGDLLAVLNNNFGIGSAATLENDTKAQILHWCSTGLYNLDEATGWGIPGGRITEFFGAESSGKTTALMAAGIENLRRGGYFVVFDAEGTFDLDRFEQMGGNPKKVIMVDPGTAEEAYDKLKAVMDWAAKQEVPENAVVLVGVDSIPMLIPQKQFDLEGEEQLVGAQARIHSFHLPTVEEKMPPNAALLLLNQVRDKIGAMAWNADGNIDTPGGRLIKHLCSVRVLFNKAGQLDNGKTKEDRQIIGMRTQFKVVKNKVAPPLRKGQFNIYFDERGVDNCTVFFDMCVAAKLMKKEAGVYSFKGKESVIQFKAPQIPDILERKPKFVKHLLSKVVTLDQIPPFGKVGGDDAGE